VATDRTVAPVRRAVGQRRPTGPSPRSVERRRRPGSRL